MSATACLREPFTHGDVRFTPYALLTPDQHAALLAMRNHDDVRRWMCTDHIIGEKEHALFCEGLQNDRKKAYFLAEKAGESIGAINLNPINHLHEYAYLGVFADPHSSQTHKGQALIKGLFHLTFGLLRLHALKLEVIDTNARAIAFYEKAGFTHEGRLRDFVKKNGAYRDACIMGILHHEADYGD